MYNVYRITSIKSSSVYYGYCLVDKDPLLQFFKQASLSAERGDAMYIANCGGHHALEAQILEQYDHPILALFGRNMHRSQDKKSYTRPSNWPGTVLKTAYDRKEATLLRAMQKARTARDAYAAGLWVPSSVNLLGLVCGRQAVMNDLDTLTPVEFDEKYFS